MLDAAMYAALELLPDVISPLPPRPPAPLAAGPSANRTVHHIQSYLISTHAREKSLQNPSKACNQHLTSLGVGTSGSRYRDCVFQEHAFQKYSFGEALDLQPAHTCTQPVAFFLTVYPLQHEVLYFRFC